LYLSHIKLSPLQPFCHRSSFPGLPAMPSPPRSRAISAWGPAIIS
jgi:hypothetical protein